jgi:hypothetical protein
MPTSEFALDLARLAKGATTLRTLTPLAPPTSVSLYSYSHDRTFRIDVFSLSAAFCLHVFDNEDVIGLAQGTVEPGKDLLLDIVRLIEQAEEEFVARKHRAALIEALAEYDPDPATVQAFCAGAGIDSKTGLSPEDCADIVSWLKAAEVRAKAAANPSVVVEFKPEARA